MLLLLSAVELELALLPVRRKSIRCFLALLLAVSGWWSFAPSAASSPERSSGRSRFRGGAVRAGAAGDDSGDDSGDCSGVP